MYRFWWSSSPSSSALTWFTVKSRRYVDFSGAGSWHRRARRRASRLRMEALFALYGHLLFLGVPRGPRACVAVLLAGNFYMTLNAREFVHMVRAPCSTGAVRAGRRFARWARR